MYEEIYKIVLQETGISKQEIKSKSRSPMLVNARALFSIICIKCLISYGKIGKEMNRDHTTIIHQYHSRINNQVIKNILERHNQKIQELKNGLIESDPKKLRFIGIATQKPTYKLLFNKYEGQCMVCGFDEVVEVHHIIPRYRGGGDELDNLALLCPNHHALADRHMLSIKGKVELIHREIDYPQE